MVCRIWSHVFHNFVKTMYCLESEKIFNYIKVRIKTCHFSLVRTTQKSHSESP